MSRFLVEISAIAGVYAENFDQILTVIEHTVQKTLSSNVMKFKAVGENKLFALVESEDTLKTLLSEVNKNSKNLVSIRSTPVRTEEEFVQNVLKVDPALCVVKTDPFKPNKKIFFSRSTFGYTGYNLEEYFEVFKKDVEFALGARLKGEIDYRAFKVITERTIYVFFAADSAGELDDKFVALPLVRSRVTSSDLNVHDTVQVEPF